MADAIFEAVSATRASSLFARPPGRAPGRRDEPARSTRWRLILLDYIRVSFRRRDCCRGGCPCVSTTAIMSAAFSVMR